MVASVKPLPVDVVDEVGERRRALDKAITRLLGNVKRWRATTPDEDIVRLVESRRWVRCKLITGLLCARLSCKCGQHQWWVVTSRADLEAHVAKPPTCERCLEGEKHGN